MNNQDHTPAQLALYEAALEYEAKRKGAREAERAQASKYLSGGMEGKSGLLSRIINDRPVLIVPPPRSYSYPWYEVIEEAGPWEVLMQAGSVQDLIEPRSSDPDAPPYRTVIVNQDVWQVTAILDDLHLQVTLPEWRELGFSWMLSLDRVSASEATQFTCSWHDPSLTRICTYQQMLNEERWHVERRNSVLKQAVDPDLEAEAIAEARAKDGNVKGVTHFSRFEVIMVQQAIEAARERLAKRRNAGLPDLPTEEELQQEVNDRIAEKTDPMRAGGFGWYSVDDAGDLHINVWRLHRLSPSNPPASIYLSSTKLDPKHEQAAE